MSKTSKQSSRLLQLWRNSQTVAWSYVQASSAAILGVITSVDSVVSTSQFKDVLNTLSTPWWVPTSIAVLALITYVAHGHDA